MVINNNYNNKYADQNANKFAIKMMYRNHAVIEQNLKYLKLTYL